LGVMVENSWRRRSKGYACRRDKFGFMGRHYPPSLRRIRVAVASWPAGKAAVFTL
jgi:hypothetical protein